MKTKCWWNVVKTVLLAAVIGMNAPVAAVEVTQAIVPAKVQQRYPWNGFVDIELTNAVPNGTVILAAKDGATETPITVKSLTLGGVPFTNGVSTVTDKSVHLVWDAQTDVGAGTFFTHALFSVMVKYNEKPKYMVVDVSGGTSATRYPVSYLEDVPVGGWTDEYKTKKIVLRRIPAGTFMMGSPEDEDGRYDNETQHPVTLTQDFWIGVFEMTQKQYALVVGSNPSFYPGDAHPVEDVSYDTIVDSSGSIAKLKAKTGLNFNLPTEAQWEYACRAGTTTALNNGRNLTNTSSSDSVMNEVGRYRDNGGSVNKHTTVGSYKPNAWGLYDMHGNVWERCLDWYTSSLGSGAVTDPVGPASGSYRVARGGSWGSSASGCRSACRGNYDPSNSHYGGGFRLFCSAGHD